MNVLIVEDEPKTREGLKKLVQMFQPTLCVDTAPDAMTALDMSAHKTYDLIYTDIRMPGMDGLQMLEKMDTENAQVIVISSYADFSYAQQAMKVGAKEYLLKPVDPQKFKAALAASVKKYWEVRSNAFRRLLNEWDHLLQPEKTQLIGQMRVGKVTGAAAWISREGELSREQITICTEILSKYCQVCHTHLLYLVCKTKILLCLCTKTQEDFQKLRQDVEQCTPEFCHFVSEDAAGNLTELYEQFQKIDKQSADQDGNPQKNIIRIAKKYIKDHLAENIVLSDMAQVTYVHPTYLSKLFKKETGQNISDYITECRIKKAKQYLKKPEYKIYEIAKACGFQDVKYFTLVFKSAVGCTPSKYRNEIT